VIVKSVDWDGHYGDCSAGTATYQTDDRVLHETSVGVVFPECVVVVDPEAYPLRKEEWREFRKGVIQSAVAARGATWS
jgi:hypothetical protein